VTRRRSISSILLCSARRVDDLEGIASGNMKRIERRATNGVVGRLLGRVGFWRRLWR
jgi:hypothetical protein